MRIVFARHGNTFGPGDRVVWVGRETDLPLVEKGVEQAERLAAGLARAGLVPSRVFCGALERTRRCAEIVARRLAIGADPVVDPRLNEVDYGRWAGRSAEEIVETLGQGEQLRRWNEEDVWPEGAGWGSTEAEIHANVAGFLADAVRHADHEILLAVSSNGVLRYVPRIAGVAAFDPERRRSFQMKTGNAGVLVRRGGAFALGCWNVGPEALAG